MKADFLDAHKRHWTDAETLFASGRYANADHLYAMATECGLKRLMVAFGMDVNPSTGSPEERDDREHADKIWVRFETYRCGHVNGTNYGLPTLNPFNKWKVSDRYVHQSNFNLASVQPHQEGAAAICELIKKAQREGLVI